MLSWSFIIIFLVNGSSQQDCNEFSLGDCQDEGEDSLMWESDKLANSKLCQEVCHSFVDCQFFNFYQGVCKLYSGNSRSNCGIVAGVPEQSLQDCLLGDITDGGCGAFLYEECQYHGQDTGLSAPAGQVTNALECEEYCQLFEGFGCTYWVFNATDLTCNLLDSTERTCWGLTGPKNPPYEDCITCNEEVKALNTTILVDLQPPEKIADVSLDCTIPIVWVNGPAAGEVSRTDDKCPSIALSEEMFKDVEFTGKFENQHATHSDMLGIVIGYEDPGHFILIASTGSEFYLHTNPNEWRLVEVDSETANESSNMTLAIVNGDSVPGQTEVVFKPEGAEGFLFKGTVYSWTIRYQPSLYSLSITIEQGTGAGDPVQTWTQQWDKTFIHHQHVGRVGVYTFSQPTRFYDMKVKPLCSV